jgi:outer membrane protein assembly factor BamB
MSSAFCLRLGGRVPEARTSWYLGSEEMYLAASGVLFLDNGSVGECGAVMHKVSLRTIKVVTVLGAVSALLAGMGGPAGAATAGSPWSQTDYNAAQSRANLAEHALTRVTVGEIRYLRGLAAPVNPPGDGCAQTAPVVTPVLTGGRLYAVTNGWPTKYNPATGRLIWRRNPDPTFSLDYRSLAVARGLVVIGELGCDSASDPNGHIQAFHASTGAPAWKKPISPDGGALAQMVVSGAYVVAAGDSPGTGDVVSVRRLATGTAVWHRLTPSCAPGAVLVVAQLVMSISCDQNHAGTLTARDLATGALAWSRAGGWQLQRGDTNAAGGRHLYVTNPRGTVAGLSPLTGKTQYSLARATHVLAVDSSRAYATCGNLGVCAYSTTTGRRRWHAQLSPAPATATEAGGVLYLDQGLALNAGTGRTISALWSGGQATSLVVGDGRIAVVTDPRVLDLYGLPGS